MLGVLAAFFAMLQLITILNRCPHFRASFTIMPASVPITKALKSPCVRAKVRRRSRFLNKTHNNP